MAKTPQPLIHVLLCRNTLVSDIQDEFAAKKAKLKDILHQVSDVSITVDIWSDRRMRSFLGVTVHYIHEFMLQSSLLSCVHITGTLSNCSLCLSPTI